MSRRILQTSVTTMTIALLLGAAASAAPRCAMVRGESVMTQPAGPFTEWVGPVSLKIRGKTYTGEGTVFIDPLLLGNSGPPSFETIGFDWFTFDLGEAGSLSAWELASLKPLDETFSTIRYEGTARIGPSYVATGVYGPSGTGIFAKATGIMHARGTVWMTFPTAPNSLVARFSGRICGIECLTPR